jgi:hypothetical protein
VTKGEGTKYVIRIFLRYDAKGFFLDHSFVESFSARTAYLCRSDEIPQSARRLWN